MKEPDYYIKNGMSPIRAFKKGLLSEEQYKGFLIGNVIKYVIRAGSKDNAIQDLKKAKHYLEFYIELLKKNTVTEPAKPIPIDINFSPKEPDLKKLKNIKAIELFDEHFDENGELKPECREEIRKTMKKWNYD